MLRKCLGALRPVQCGQCSEAISACGVTLQRWTGTAAAPAESVASTSDRDPASPAKRAGRGTGSKPPIHEPRVALSPVLRRMRLENPDSFTRVIPPLEQRPACPSSVRTGLVAVKVGMMSEWDEHGVLTPYTVLWFDDNEVTCVKAEPADVTTALQIGCGSKKAKRLRMSEVGNFVKQGVAFKSKLVEFKVSRDALMPVGTKLSAAHFVAGHCVDVTAITKGKGFAGGMKRWGFKGQGASHGVSLAHRSPGAIGQQGYARVLPGKKMAGRMGGKRRLIRNMWIHRVDPQRNLIWVKGSVHGAQGCFVMVRDARRKQLAQMLEQPFPTHIGALPEPTQAKPTKNPYDAYKD